MTNGELVKIILPLVRHQNEINRIANVLSEVNIEIYEAIPSLSGIADAVFDVFGFLPEHWPYTDYEQLEKDAKAAGRTMDEYIASEKLFCREYLHHLWYGLTDAEQVPTVEDVVALVNKLRSEVQEQEKYYGTVSHGGSKDLE